MVLSRVKIGFDWKRGIGAKLPKKKKNQLVLMATIHNNRL